ncbi:MAG TPA: ABC transporter permease [Gemmatimonadaceae bacterium]|nr:ABC transporter permease [Gemmatimonadaceae bacterium]
MPLVSALSRLRSLWRNVVGKARVEHDLDEHVRSYADLLAAEKVRAGLSPADARRAALVELGGIEHVKDEVRDVRSGALLDTMAQDVRYAARTLIRRPGFAIVAVTALALGIGATTAIFSVVTAVLLRPLPYADPDGLMAVLHESRNPTSPANYLDWKRENSVFSSLGAAESWSGNVSGDAPERVHGLRVTSDILAMTGIRPLMGRVFRAEDDQPSGEQPLVLSWGYWQRRFSGRSDAVGQRLVIDGGSYVVVGVMPRGFDFPMFWATNVQAFAPLQLGERATSRRGSSLRIFGRLRPGVTIESARAQMATVTANLENTFPGTNRDVTVTPLATKVVGNVRMALFVLLGAVGFVLLIACANVAHMLLARATARQREMTVRLALGASRARLLRQMLTESVVLSLAGGVVGVALARVGLNVLIALAGDSIPRADGITLDLRVLAFSGAISLATGVAFGLLPAMRVSRTEMSEALRDGARGSTEGGQRARLRWVLVGSEIALALMLLTGAGLAIRSFLALRAIDPGFDPRGVLTAVVSLKGTAEQPAGRRTAFHQSVLERVRQLPGVEAASMINHAPIAGDIWGFPFALEGRPMPRPEDTPAAAYRVVFPGYFRTMRLPILQGRDIAETDRVGSTPVVLVNEIFAKRWWPNENAVGKRITLDPGEPEPTWVTVIGVVKNAVRADWSAPAEEEMFLPYLQTRSYLESDGGHVAYMTLVARMACARGDHCTPESLAPSVRQVVASLDRAVPVTEMRSMDDIVSGANAGPRFTLVLLATFATVALLLAAVGIYGVISYAVSRRTHEIGVRMALGATPRTVVGLIIGQGMRVVVAGVLVGVAGALLVTRLMTTVVYGVHVTDPVTYVGVTVLLTGVALLASYIPARRATRIDPLVAMRSD